MGKKVNKWFWAWQFDKEEAWLNEMADNGLCLINVRLGQYEFEDCQPGEYTIRLQLLENNSRSNESIKYITSIEESGAEKVGSIMGWVYFRKRKIDGEFELFGDTNARIKHIDSILLVISVFLIFDLLIGIYNLYLFVVTKDAINLSGILNLIVGVYLFKGCHTISSKKKLLLKK